MGCDRYRLEVHDARPDRSRKLIWAGRSTTFQIARSNKRVAVRGNPQGLALDAERALATTFDFDTPVVEMEKTRRAFKPLGMEKLPGVLAWKLEPGLREGYHRILYVDSHTGDVVKFAVVDAHGARVLDVAQHDYRAIDGIRVPFAVDYRDPDGTLLASDRIARVAVKLKQP